MEATLFWIGVGLFLYCLMMTQLFRRNLLGHQGLAGLLHLLFYGAGCALVGFVVSASTELHGPTAKFPLIGMAFGFAWAGWHLVSNRGNREKNLALLSEDHELGETSYSAFILAAVIMYTVVQAFKIPSGSMENTLRIGDHLFVNKFIYGVKIPLTEKRILRLRPVKREDIVVFEAPLAALQSPVERERGVKKDFIKRAIGLPGDVVEIRNKKVFLNGQAMTEPYVTLRNDYISPAAPLRLSKSQYQDYWETGKFSVLRTQDIGDNFGPVTVPEGHYFVMGDNRDGSFDSRFWGPLPGRMLKGRAWVVYLSWGQWPWGLFNKSRTFPFAGVRVIR